MGAFEDKVYSAMKEELHPWQSEYLDIVEWLVLPQKATRGEGRTHLLAIVFIRAAMLAPGEWIYPFDHYASGVPLLGHKNIQSSINSILSNSSLKHLFDFKSGAFRYAKEQSPLDYSCLT